MKHEHKTCPRCGNHFECRPGDISHCQCYGVNLPVDQKNFLEENYGDCLCVDCLNQLAISPAIQKIANE